MKIKTKFKSIKIITKVKLSAFRLDVIKCLDVPLTKQGKFTI